MKKEKTKSEALTAKHWLGYMFGDFGGCMTFTLMSSLFTMYCTNALGVDTMLLGTLVIIWTIWDAINDPLMGALMDKAFAKKQTKNGKFRPWLLRATPLLAITAIILWTVPTFFDGIPMIVALFSCKIFYEASYTMFNIPMGSLLSAMSKNDTERASLSSARGVGSMIGNMIPAMLGPVIVQAFGDTNTLGYTIAGSACAIVGFVVCFLHYALTEERVVVTEEEKADNIKITDIVEVFKKNRPFVALCIHGLCICTMQYAAQTLGLYMYSAVYHDLTYQTIGTVLSSPFMIGAMVVVPFLCKKWGLEKIIRYSLLIGGGIFGLLFLGHMVMYVPPIVHGIVSGIASGVAMVSIQMQWGLVGEAIDYNEYITGKRTEGSIYGTFNLSRRIGQTIGNGFSLYALGWIGYVGTATQQAPGTIVGLKVICVLLPAIFVLGSWFAFKFVWNITPEVREKMAEMKKSSQNENLSNEETTETNEEETTDVDSKEDNNDYNA